MRIIKLFVQIDIHSHTEYKTKIKMERKTNHRFEIQFNDNERRIRFLSCSFIFGNIDAKLFARWPSFRIGRDIK